MGRPMNGPRAGAALPRSASIESIPFLVYDRPTCPAIMHHRRGQPMGIVEKPQTRTQAADFDRFRLRGFVDGLGGELETIDAPTDLADVAAILEGNPKAVLFRALGPERAKPASIWFRRAICAPSTRRARAPASRCR